MAYGDPSIDTAMNELRRKGCQRILVLPLYPQYSGATTGSIFDAVARVLSTWRRVPTLRTVTDYHENPEYVAALKSSVEEAWRARVSHKFLGLPSP